MTDRFFKELQKASKNKPSFQVLVNNEWKVCDNIAILPFGNETLGKYLQDKENAYNSRIEALGNDLKKQNEIIINLVEAIKKLNGGA